jgi:hypothetical protein
MKVKSTVFAQAAIDALALGITYQQEDCQAFVEQTVKRAGGEMPDYRGSNDMFRNACDRVHPLDVSIREGLIAPGCVLFIVENDGGEPAQYKTDGLGNASHIGIYTGGTPEVVHSSSSRGGVVGSTLKNGWTHVGWLTAVDYLNEDAPTQMAEVVAVSGKSVRMRVRPDRGAVANANVPVGAVVKVLQQQPDWWQISHGSKTGWMMREFLRLVEEDLQPVDDVPPDQVDIDRVALLVEMQGMLTRQQAIIRALMGVM